MRALPLVALLLVAALAAPALAAGATYTARYVSNPLVTPRIVGSFTGLDPGIGGSVFPTHPHDTTATITVSDSLAGAISALVCQDRNNNLVCDAVPGSADAWACFTGSLSGFAVQGATPGSPKRTSVYVAFPGFQLEVCNTPGQATTGFITVSYS